MSVTDVRLRIWPVKTDRPSPDVYSDLDHEWDESDSFQPPIRGEDGMTRKMKEKNGEVVTYTYCKKHGWRRPDEQPHVKRDCKACSAAEAKNQKFASSHDTVKTVVAHYEAARAAKQKNGANAEMDVDGGVNILPGQGKEAAGTKTSSGKGRRARWSNPKKGGANGKKKADADGEVLLVDNVEITQYDLDLEKVNGKKARMNFGQYKGKTLEWVQEIDPSYCKYLYDGGSRCLFVKWAVYHGHMKKVDADAETGEMEVRPAGLAKKKAKAPPKKKAASKSATGSAASKKKAAAKKGDAASKEKPEAKKSGAWAKGKATAKGRSALGSLKSSNAGSESDSDSDGERWPAPKKPRKSVRSDSDSDEDFLPDEKEKKQPKKAGKKTAKRKRST